MLFHLQIANNKYLLTKVMNKITGNQIFSRTRPGTGSGKRLDCWIIKPTE